jgi:pSer/pThr/pTyr-binding forkhead associated (FHA) protein
MSKSWTIGSGPDCDLVVDLPKVSGRHCRLTRSEDGYTLEDLGSTNGTFVNGVRIDGSIPVTRRDTITLGLATPMPWPTESMLQGSKVLRIGREPDNDLVVDLPMVSGHHALVVWEPRTGLAVIEDLGSSNGTAVGTPDRKVTRSAISPVDTIYLGSHPLPAALLLARIDSSLVPSLSLQRDELVIGRDPSCGCVVNLPTVSSRHARLKRSGDRISIEDLASSNGTFVNGERIDGEVDVRPGDLIGLGGYAMLLAVEPEATVAENVGPPGEAGSSRRAPVGTDGQPGPRSTGPRRRFAEILFRSRSSLLLLLQAPVVAAGIVVVMRLSNRATTAPEGGSVVAATLFWLGLAAAWFGLSDAVLGNIVDAGRLRDGSIEAGVGPLARRLAALVALCAIQCAIAWWIVSAAAGLAGPGPSAVGLLVLAALVGSAAGLLIVALAPRPAVAWALLGPVVLVLWLFGGERQALPRMGPPARAVANVLPSRWAFEGLLLLEADARARREPTPADVPDLAEDYFPAETERTGPRGAAMALGFLLVGLAASVAFTARALRPA